MTLTTPGHDSRKFATAKAFWLWRFMRTARVFTAAQHQETVHRPRHSPNRVLKEGQPLGQVRLIACQGSTYHIGMTSEILGRRVNYQVRSQL